MKIKTSYLIYAVIATVFAGLSMVTDIFCSGYGIMVCIIYHSGNKQSIPKCGNYTLKY